MSVKKFRIHSKAIRTILEGEETQALLQKLVDDGVEIVGEEYAGEVKVVGGSSKMGRAMGYVSTATYAGRRDQAENNTLQEMIGRLQR